LVVLAAGVGSRYGGLKQLDPVGPGGAALMDYTIYDAVKAGFGRVVLVIRRETEAEIRDHVDRGAARQIDVKCVFQELDAVPDGFVPPEERVKPWGTGHAMLVASSVLDGPFVVANADDFYGRSAVAALAGFLEETGGSEPPHWAMVGYRLADTLPVSGAVSRALCVQNGDGWLVRLQEIPAIERAGGVARWTDADGIAHVQPLASLVSMNLWGFTADLAAELKKGFSAFLDAGPGPGDEFYLPVAVGEAVRGKRARVKVLDEGGRWCGMTSPEDRATTAGVLAELVEAGEYPERLWE
jgi:hypothetical protein